MAWRSSLVAVLSGAVVATTFGCSYPVSDFTTTTDGGTGTDTSTGGDGSVVDTGDVADSAGRDTFSGSDTNPGFDTTPSADGACTPPTENCSGVCVDTNSDHDNCGLCGHKCDATQKCVGGKCRGG